MYFHTEKRIFYHAHISHPVIELHIYSFVHVQLFVKALKMLQGIHIIKILDILFSYDGHIALNSYPFLDNKEEFAYTSLAEDVAKPR